MKITERSGLILEGGGMRGVFTCGVLDYLMDKKIEFPYTIGVSAGACNGLSYISQQRGRAKYSNINLLEKYNYIGVKYLVKKGNIMDFDMMFHTFPEVIIPYDYEMLANTKQRFEMVTTNCLTGEAHYYEEKNDPKRVIEILTASCSLPFVCPISYVDGIPMLDGGIADSIPIKRARSLGYDNNVVVLTRNKGYRKSENNMKIASMFYRDYPEIQEAIRNRSKIYNEQISMIEEMEDRNELIVIRPQKPISVGRMERNTKKLLDFYEEGYEEAKRILGE